VLAWLFERAWRRHAVFSRLIFRLILVIGFLGWPLGWSVEESEQHNWILDPNPNFSQDNSSLSRTNCISFAKTYRNIYFLIRTLGMDGIVMETEDLPNLIQESGLLTFAWGGHKVLLGK
jgi:hypothetical protein